MRQTIILILLVLITLVSCGTEVEETQMPAGLTENSGEYATYLSCIDRCDQCEANCLDTVYYDMAIVETNSGICNRITSVSLQELCAQELRALEAIATKNPDTCLDLTEGAQEVCLLHVYAELAVEAQTSSICDSLEEPEQCVEIFSKNMAMMTGDPVYCDDAGDPENCLLQIDAVEEPTFG
jgi:hypothetical protein